MIFSPASMIASFSFQRMEYWLLPMYWYFLLNMLQYFFWQSGLETRKALHYNWTVIIIYETIFFVERQLAVSCIKLNFCPFLFSWLVASGTICLQVSLVIWVLIKFIVVDQHRNCGRSSGHQVPKAFRLHRSEVMYIRPRSCDHLCLLTFDFFMTFIENTISIYLIPNEAIITVTGLLRTCGNLLIQICGDFPNYFGVDFFYNLPYNASFCLFRKFRFLTIFFLFALYRSTIVYLYRLIDRSHSVYIY